MKNITILFLLVILTYCGYAQTEKSKAKLPQALRDHLASQNLKNNSDSTGKKPIGSMMQTINGKTVITLIYPEDLESPKPPSVSDSLAKVWYEATERGEEIDPYDYSDKDYPLPYYVKLIVQNYIKAKVTKKETRHYKDEEWNYDYPAYEAVVTEILKGNLNPGDNFTFDATTLLEPNPEDFVVGEEYFMPLDALADTSYYGNDYSLYIFTEYDNDAQYLVKNNILYDKDNFWGLGTEVPWDKFKQAFMDDVRKIKSYK